MVEFSFPRAEASGSSSHVEDRDSDKEDRPPPLASTSVTPKIGMIQGEEEEIEDREQSLEPNATL